MNSLRKLILLFVMFYSKVVVYGQKRDNFSNRETDSQIPHEVEQNQNYADVLQKTLDELISQRHVVQQAHWNVQGPLFHSLHEMLGDFYETLNAQIDVARIIDKQLWMLRSIQQ